MEHWIIPVDVYKKIMEESSIEDTDKLKKSHETTTNHLGSHRKVISRMF